MSYARSPTQASFHHSPGGRSQPSKPSTPVQPTFNGTLHSPNSPQTALPSIASTIYPRETPVSNYYDPTQDAGDRGISRGGARYEAYGPDVRIPFPASIISDGKPSSWQNKIPLTFWTAQRRVQQPRPKASNAGSLREALSSSAIARHLALPCTPFSITSSGAFLHAWSSRHYGTVSYITTSVRPEQLCTAATTIYAT
jgi:hypothetical protein